MKKFIMLVCLIQSYSSFAGGDRVGNGGKSVVCRDEENKIIAAELLDVWEGKNIFNLNMNENGEVDSLILSSIEKLNNSLEQSRTHIVPLVNRVKKIMKFTKSDVILKDIDDAAEVALPKNCKLEQLANYLDDSLLIVNSEIWNKLDYTSKAGLILHEAIYRFERQFGATNSRRTRKVVAHLLSDFKFENVKAGLPSNAKECKAVDTNGYIKYKFWVYSIIDPRGNNITQSQFAIVNGEFVYSRVVAIFDKPLPWEIQNTNGIFTEAITSSTFESYGFISIGSYTNTQMTSQGAEAISYLYLENDSRDNFEIYCEY